MKLKDFNQKLREEYHESYPTKAKKGFKWQFKLRYAFLLLLVLGIGFLIGEHQYTNAYNRSLLRYEEALFSEDSQDLIQITSKKDYLNKVYYKAKKRISIWTFLVEFLTPRYKNKGADFVDEGVPEDTPNDDAVGDSYETNIQEAGVLEADVSKCDGSYIYTVGNGSLIIYDLAGLVVSKTKSIGIELYIYQNKIIVFSYAQVTIYHFDGEDVSELFTYQFEECYLNSRLINDNLYIIGWSKNGTDMDYADLYYDGCSSPYGRYEIIRYDLATNETMKVQNLNSGSAVLYMSQTHIYLATSIYGLEKMITVVSIFDLDLKPVGAVKVHGYALNQFSMDEYNGYFRIATCDRYAETTKMNAVSIYDLNTLTRVGYLNEGIGLPGQIIKSVSFKGDTCHIVTYQNSDPLYAIDLSDSTNPVILSAYEAPGYSSYLKNFTINGQDYLLGIGFDDDLETRKISIYLDNGETTQIGYDYLISPYYYSEADLVIMDVEFNRKNFDNHKALFIYNDNENLYLGLKASMKTYYIFKIDVDAQEVVTLAKEYTFTTGYHDSRAYLVNGKLYITDYNALMIENW